MILKKIISSLLLMLFFIESSRAYSPCYFSKNETKKDITVALYVNELMDTLSNSVYSKNYLRSVMSTEINNYLDGDVLEYRVGYNTSKSLNEDLVVFLTSIIPDRILTLAKQAVAENMLVELIEVTISAYKKYRGNPGKMLYKINKYMEILSQKVYPFTKVISSLRTKSKIVLAISEVVYFTDQIGTFAYTYNKSDTRGYIKKSIITNLSNNRRVFVFAHGQGNIIVNDIVAEIYSAYPDSKDSLRVIGVGSTGARVLGNNSYCTSDVDLVVKSFTTNALPWNVSNSIVYKDNNGDLRFPSGHDFTNDYLNKDNLSFLQIREYYRSLLDYTIYPDEKSGERSGILTIEGGYSNYPVNYELSTFGSFKDVLGKQSIELDCSTVPDGIYSVHANITYDERYPDEKLWPIWMSVVKNDWVQDLKVVNIPDGSSRSNIMNLKIITDENDNKIYTPTYYY